MLPHRQDAEDALQDIFVRAYSGLRANHRELALRAWLYRVAHNRCIDELRRPSPPPPEVMELLRAPASDPIAEADRRESLRRLIADVRRLPEQQRSALLMRELGGMSYADMASALGVTIPAVKSLLVRARLALGQAIAARDTACSEIRDELMLSHDRGRRPNATARRHMRDCAGCREFRHDLRGVSRRFAAIVPTLGPLGVLANALGVGGAGGGAAGGAVAAGAGGAAGTGSAAIGVGAMSAGATHVATLLAAAVVTAGGAVELQHTITVPATHHHRHARAALIAPSHHVTSPSARQLTAANVNPPEEAAPTVIAPPAHAQVLQSAPTTPAVATPVQTTVTTSTTTVAIPSKTGAPATGGSSTMIAGGGATPDGAGTKVTNTSNKSSSTGSSATASTTSTTATGQTTGTSGSSTSSSSTNSDGSTTSSTAGGSSQGTTSGTSTTPASTLGESPPPAP